MLKQWLSWKEKDIFLNSAFFNYELNRRKRTPSDCLFGDFLQIFFTSFLLYCFFFTGVWNAPVHGHFKWDPRLADAWHSTHLYIQSKTINFSKGIILLSYYWSGACLYEKKNQQYGKNIKTRYDIVV